MIQTSSEMQLIELIASAGGGSFSIKGEITDVTGEKIPAIRMQVIPPSAAEPESFTLVDLAFIRKLAAIPDLLQEARLAALRTHVLDAAAAPPPPDILIHAAIPENVVVQVNAPALLLQGPSATLAGGDSIDDVVYALRKMLAVVGIDPEAKSASAESASCRLTPLLPVLRGLLARPTEQDNPYQRIIVRALSTWEVLDFLAMDGAQARTDAMPLCEAHAEYLGGRPLWVEIADASDPAHVREQVAAALSAYAEKHAGAMPRVVLLPGLGAVCAGADARDAHRAAVLTGLALTALHRTAASPKTQEFVQAQPAIAGLPLHGHVALVTGAAGAIGAGICRGLLLQGCHVAVTDLASERLDALVNELREIDAERVIGVPLDVTSAESVDGGIAQIVEAWGGVDIAIINAGVAHVSPLAEMDLEVFRRLERINVEGALLLLRAMARHFKLQNTGGDIVMISTKNVFAPGATFGAYSATKAAAHQLARIACLELADIGVRVNMVAPDAVFSDHGTRKSGLWQEVGPSRMRARGLDEAGLEEYYRSRNLLKARITPDHVANAVLFFVTRQTPTTGATIPVDGGLPDAVPR